MMSILKRMAALAAAVAMASCGGGSGGGTSPFGGGGGGVVPPPVASDIALTLSATNITNSGTQTVAVEVTAVDAARVALAGIPVTFSVDNNAVIVVGSTATDSSGKIRATVGIGNDKSNRVVTVKAISGELQSAGAFQVTGAKLAATAVPAVLAPGAAGEVQYRLTDTNSNPISGVAVAVTGNGIAAASGTTGSNGEFVLKYTAPAQTGTVDIIANSAGVTATTSVIVQAGSGSIPSVAPGSVLSASVSANPSVVSVNTATTSNRSEIRALFLGANNAPIKNVRVRFDLDGDANSIGGAISSGSTIVYTDVNGVASTAYIPGSRSSPTDGLTVRACWGNTDADLAASACPNATRTTLTVISEALAVTIGFNNKLEEGAGGLTYIQRFVVLVVDSSGQAKADVQITPSIDLPYYFKGSWIAGTTSWAQSIQTTCDNEDLNRNGVLEVASEDLNLSASLEPRKSDVAISIVGSGKTDASGIAILKIEYPKSHGSWVAYKILVAASGISGTEGRTTHSDVLGVLAADIGDIKIRPPFKFSPYGVLASPVVPAVGPNGQTVFLCTVKD